MENLLAAHLPSGYGRYRLILTPGSRYLNLEAQNISQLGACFVPFGGSLILRFPDLLSRN